MLLMAVQPSHLFPIKQSRIYLHMFSQPKVYASSFQTIEMLIKEDKLSSLKAYIIKEPPCEPQVWFSDNFFKIGDVLSQTYS